MHMHDLMLKHISTIFRGPYRRVVDCRNHCYRLHIISSYSLTGLLKDCYMLDLEGLLSLLRHN
jgi:hypothetical protein